MFLQTLLYFVQCICLTSTALTLLRPRRRFVSPGLLNSCANYTRDSGAKMPFQSCAKVSNTSLNFRKFVPAEMLAMLRMATLA